MAEIALPIVVTAIANSELESFVAGTLFSQGWNVVFRALDIASLITFIEADTLQSRNIVLIYSPDLPGMSAEAVMAMQSKVRHIVGFTANSESDQNYAGLCGAPHDASELLNLVRGFVRAPLLRSAVAERPETRRARVIAIGSSSGSAGCTSLAINLATELSTLGRETLLLDADVRHPSVAPLLSLHKLGAEHASRTIASNLSVSEFTRERVPELAGYLDGLFGTCDFAIIDLGSIERVSDSLTDRRWTSSLIHWSCEQADDLWLVSKSDVLSIHRLESLVHDFSQITIRAKVSSVLNMNSRGRKGKLREELFLATVAPLRPQRMISFPRDARAMVQAEEERATLVEINDRSPLRKSIAKIAVELST